MITNIPINVSRKNIMSRKVVYIFMIPFLEYFKFTSAIITERLPCKLIGNNINLKQVESSMSVYYS